MTAVRGPTAGRSVLILSRHHPRAASSRLRTYQYIPYLEAMGWSVRASHFFDEAYLRSLYRSGGRRAGDVARAYLRRVRALLSLRQASVVWVEKEVFPFLPGLAESLLARSGVPYVVDYDDATFHTYDLHRHAVVRALLGNKLDPLLRGAQAVTVGNAYLQSYARTHGAREVVKIPTVVDIDRYSLRDEPPDQELRIGWIGTPKTAKYLEQLYLPLRMAARNRRLRLVTIGAPALGDVGFPVEQHEWSSESETGLLASLHMGVMPLPDEPWERGKCGYKLIQYMACGRPVIASPVGVNTEIVTPAVGLLVRTEAEWLSAIERLAADPVLRARLGSNGRRRVEAEYALQVTAPRIEALLRRIALQHA